MSAFALGPHRTVPDLHALRSTRGILMIKLTRLDGEPFVLNAELIRYVERRPDTFITLTSGDRIVVAETMDEVVERSVHYQQQKHFMPVPQTSSPVGRS